MTLSDLKDTVLERLRDISNRVSENETVIQLMERYRNLSPVVQKVIIASMVFFAGYMIYSVPASFINSSKEYEEMFASNRALIRGLFRSARNPSISADRFQGPTFDDMKTRAEGFMTEQTVVETQKGAFAPMTRPLQSKALPKTAQQTGTLM